MGQRIYNIQGVIHRPHAVLQDSVDTMSEPSSRSEHLSLGVGEVP